MKFRLSKKSLNMVDKMIESKPSESEDLNDSQRTEKYFDSSFVVLVPKL